jgi:predicted amidohydrolase
VIREPLPSFSGVVLAAALGACATAPAPTPPSPAPRTPSALPAEVPAGAHRIAALQYEIRSRRAPSDILAELDVAVGRAAAAGAELVLLPELFVLDVWPASVEDEPAFVRRVARDTTPVLLEGLAAVARDHGAAVLAGSVPELRGEGLFNTAYLFFPDGRHVRQDKMYLTAWGKRVGMTPGRRLETFDAPWGRTVILVCYDVEIPSLSARLVATRPEVILVPSMTESTHGYHRVRWAAQARAVEHHAYVVVAGTVGTPSPDWPHFGQAAFLTPRDAGFPGLLAEGPYNAPALVLADLDLEKLRASRASASFYPAKDVELHRAAGPREE